MDTLAFRRCFSSLPTMITQRVVLKKIDAGDAWDMYAYASLDETSRYLLWSPHCNIDETRGYMEYINKKYRRGDYADWGVYTRDKMTLIGTVGFASVDFENDRAELGYVLSPMYWRRGYMGEAVERVLNLAFVGLSINRIELRIMEGNANSVHFAEKHGFKREGRGVNELLIKGRYSTILHYALLRDEYLNSRKI